MLNPVLGHLGAVLLDAEVTYERDAQLLGVLLLPAADLRQEPGAVVAVWAGEDQSHGLARRAQVIERDLLARKVREPKGRGYRAHWQPRHLMRPIFGRHRAVHAIRTEPRLQRLEARQEAAVL